MRQQTVYGVDIHKGRLRRISRELEQVYDPQKTIRGNAIDEEFDCHVGGTLTIKVLTLPLPVTASASSRPIFGGGAVAALGTSVENIVFHGKKLDHPESPPGAHVQLRNMHDPWMRRTSPLPGECSAPAGPLSRHTKCKSSFLVISYS